MTRLMSFLDLRGVILESLGRASLQMLLPMGLLILAEMSRRSIPASIKCWIYRVLFLKILLLFLFPFSLSLPVLPSAAPLPKEVSPLGPVMAELRGASSDSSGVTTSVARSRSRNSLEVFSWEMTLFTLWSIGVGLVICRTWAESRLGRQYATLGKKLIDVREKRMLNELAIGLNLKRLPELRSTQTSLGPLLLGILRPVILIPQWLLESEVDLKLAVAHELAHCRRRDLAWNLLARVVQCLFFFHPLIWWSLRRYHVAVEIACDQSALRITGESHRVYGELLLQSLQTRPRSAPARGFSLALAPFTCLKERLMAISSGSFHQKHWSATAMLLIAITALSLPPLTLAQQQSPPGLGGTSREVNSSSGSGGSSKSISESGGTAGGSVEGSAGGTAGGSAGGNAQSRSDTSATSLQSISGGVGRLGRGPSDGSRDPLKPASVMSKTLVSSQKTSRSVAIHDGETLIEITETPDKIQVRVTITEEDAEKVEVYRAKNVEELKRTSPKGYELYEQHILREEHEQQPQDHRQTDRIEQTQRKFEELIREQRELMEKNKQDFDERVRLQKEEQRRILREFQKPSQ